MITRSTCPRNDDGPEALTRATARWLAYRAALSYQADRLNDAPSQILAGFRVWRTLRVDPQTGREVMS